MCSYLCEWGENNGVSRIFWKKKSARKPVYVRRLLGGARFGLDIMIIILVTSLLFSFPRPTSSPPSLRPCSLPYFTRSYSSSSIIPSLCCRGFLFFSPCYFLRYVFSFSFFLVYFSSVSPPYRKSYFRLHVVFGFVVVVVASMFGCPPERSARAHLPRDERFVRLFVRFSYTHTHTHTHSSGLKR